MHSVNWGRKRGKVNNTEQMIKYTSPLCAQKYAEEKEVSEKALKNVG